MAKEKGKLKRNLSRAKGISHKKKAKPLIYITLGLLVGLFIGIIAILIIGNILYKMGFTGKAIEEIAPSYDDSVIAQQIANDQTMSNVDVSKVVNLNMGSENSKLMSFDTPNGSINLNFDLLNYSEWVINDNFNEVNAENLNIDVNSSKEKYKWGYNVKLDDLNFMARIDVSSDQDIVIVDNETLKIGKSYLSFSDLAKQGYVVRVEQPVVLGEVNLSEMNMTLNESNVTEINMTVNESGLNESLKNVTTENNFTEGNLSGINESNNESVNENNNTAGNIENNTNENNPIENNSQTSEPSGSSEQTNQNPGITSNVGGEVPKQTDQQTVNSPQSSSSETITSSGEGSSDNSGVTGNVIKSITGFIVRGTQGINGLVINEPQNRVVSVYIQKDFNLPSLDSSVNPSSDISSDNSSGISSSATPIYQDIDGDGKVSVGDIINLDPSLIFIESGSNLPLINFTNPTPGNGTTTANTSLIVNVSISNGTNPINSVIYNWNGTNYTMYNNSLVLMYNFDNLSSLGENSTYIVDVSKYGNNGTVSGASWVSSGKYNGAYSFNGVNQYINTTNGLGISGNTSFTLEAWVNPNSLYVPAITTAVIIGRTFGLYANFFMGVMNGTANGCNNSLGVSFSWDNVYGSCAGTAGQWNHLVAVYNTTNIIIYVNGVRLKTIADGNSALVDGKGTIGELGDFNAYFWNGTIDDVRIWNRSLSDSEIYEQYISNLNKYNSTQWYLYINQSQNATTGLAVGNYTYQVFASDNSGNVNQTEQRIINTYVSDTSYPQFSTYLDNNGSIVSGGTALFNVTVTNTNGTVLLSINGTNYSATNLTASVYNVSVSGLSDGTYSYNWSAFGNGTSHLLNTSNTRNYLVNINTSISACGTLSSPSTVYSLTQNITGACLYINADFVTVNGNGYTINGDIHLDTTSSRARTGFVLNNTILNGTIYAENLSCICNGGSVSVYNSTIGSVFGRGGSYNQNGGNGSTLTFTNSIINGLIWNYGGDGGAGEDPSHNPGIGGSQTYINSNVSLWAISIGGHTDFAIYFAAGNMNFVNTNITTSSTLAYGACGLGCGIASLTLNNSMFYNSNGSILYPYLITNISNPSSTSFNSNTLSINNNSAWVNSTSYPDFNRSANVTLIGISTSFTNPVIYRNGNISCNSTTSPTCYNFTSLNAGNVVFNVSSWTNYSVGEGPDTSYPQFSTYLDNNGSIVSGGTALFNVTVTNTNGTVLLSINGTNYSATNLTANVYNASVSGLLNGTYSYNWSAFGNGTSHLLNTSNTRNYTLNAGAPPIWNQSSENSSEWWMFRKYLNHTAWDGISYYTIPGLNMTSFTTGGAIQSSPAVANGYVYVSSDDGTIYQLNASNISQKIANFIIQPPLWIHSSPAVANGYVYIGGYNNRVHLLNASNISQEIANFITSTPSDSDNSPAVANGYIYIGNYQLNTDIKTNFYILSSYSVANGYVYIGTYGGYVPYGSTFYSQGIYQFNATNISQVISNFTADVTWSSSAVANGYVYVGSDDHNVYQLNASNVSQKISNFLTGDGVESSPAVANGYVYVGSDDNQTYQLNASNISQKISNYTTGGIVFSSPAVANGYVYIGSYDHNVYQLNASNISQKIASFATGNIVRASPAVANGYVYIGSNDGNVYQLNATNISLTNTDTSYPQFSNNLTSIASGSQYNPGNSYMFNITIANTNGTAGIQFNGVNYSLSNVSNSFYYNLGSLGVGTYSYYYWAYGSGSSHLFNISQNYSYSVAQNNSYNMTILGTTPITYLSQAGISTSACPSQISCNLYRNNTNGTITNPDNSVLSAGLYNYTFNSSGGTNYSAKSTSFVLTVNKNNSNCSVHFNATTPQNYPYKFLVYSDCNSNFTLYRNGTIISNNSMQDLRAGTYNFTVIRTDNQNYTYVSNESDFVINKAIPVLTFLANSGTSNFSISYPQQINITAIASEGIVGLDKDEVNYLSSNGLNVSTAVGSYIFRANITGNENYSNIPYSYYNVTINKANSSVYLYLNGNRNDVLVISGNSVLLSASKVSGEGIIQLYLNGNLINSGTSLLSNNTIFDNPGLNNVTAVYPESQNYSGSYETHFVNVVSSGSSISINLVSPENETSYTSDSQSITFNYQVNSSLPLDNCSLIINNSISLTNSSISNTSFNGSFIQSFVPGSYSWNIRCFDNTGSLGTSETRNFVVNSPGSGSGTGGGGGGGGGGVAKSAKTAHILDFSLSDDVINTNSKQGDTIEKEITILNNESVKQTFEDNVSDSLKDLVVLSDKNFDISPQQEKKLKLTFVSTENTKPDVYSGILDIKTKDRIRQVNILYTVNERSPLFDIELKIPEEFKKIQPGGKLFYNVNLFNLGETKRIDASIEYFLKDFKNNTILTNQEVVAVETRSSLSKTFNLPSDLKPGDYFVVAKVKYGNSTGISSDSFKIVGQNNFKININLLIILLIILIIGILVAIYKIYQFYKKRREVIRLKKGSSYF